jgi:hypothetical protein
MADASERLALNLPLADELSDAAVETVVYAWQCFSDAVVALLRARKRGRTTERRNVCERQLRLDYALLNLFVSSGHVRRVLANDPGSK